METNGLAAPLQCTYAGKIEIQANCDNLSQLH